MLRLRMFPCGPHSWAGLLTAILLAIPVSAVPAQNTGDVNLAAALENTCVIGILTPQRAIADKSAELVPWELISVAGVEEFGIDPLAISRLFVFVKTPEALDRPPAVGLVLLSTQPLDEEGIVAATVAELIPGDGPKIYHSGRTQLAFTLANPTTLVAVSDPTMLPAILTKPTGPPEGPLVDKLRASAEGNDAAIVVSVDSLRTPIKTQLANSPQFPPPFERLKSLPDMISTVELHANVSKGIGGTITAVDEQAAGEIETIVENMLQLGKQMLLAEIQQDAQPGNEAVSLASQRYIQRVSASVIEALRPRRRGADLVFFDHGEGQSMSSMAGTGVLVGLLLPAVQAARESARRMSSANNLKHLGLAMHNYADVNRKLPAHASYDADGKPLLSWRVHILPYVEQQALYEQFRLDEPWDSPHNIKLSEIQVPLYQCPNLAPSNKTVYLAPHGQGLFMDGNKQRGFIDITDGTSNTIIIVEANPEEAVIWTKPDDLEVDLENPMKGLGRLRPGIFNALFADGSVRAIANDVDPALLKAMFTIAGGEIAR